MSHWRTYPRISVTLDPLVLRIIDLVDEIVWINSAPAADANIIRLRQ
jgi:hypothetical protein